MIDRNSLIDEVLQDIRTMRHSCAVRFGLNKESSVTPSQSLVLNFVEKHTDSSVKNIAKALQISSSAVTQLIDGLVQNEMLIRIQSSEDRRVIKLSLSSKAKKMLKTFRKHGLEKSVAIFCNLTYSELKQYAQLNKKIIEGMSK